MHAQAKARRSRARKAAVAPPLRRGRIRTNRRISKKTKAIYLEAVKELKNWMKGFPLLNSDTIESADTTLSDYFDWLYFEGEDPGKGRNAKCGLARERGWATHGASMPLSRMTLEGWAKATKVNVRDAAPWEMVAVVAWGLVQNEPTRHAVLSAFGSLIHFDVYCRGAEGLSILKLEVIQPVPGSRRYKHWAFIFGAGRLNRRTKVGKIDDTVPVGKINPKRSFVQKLVVSLYQRCRANCPLFDELTLSQYEAQLRLGSKILGLSDFWITPHKLRHGGPSTDILDGVTDTDGAANHGRWGSEVSCRIYKQPGALLKVAQRMSTTVRDTAASLLANDGERLVRELRGALRRHPQPAGVQRPPLESEAFEEDDVE